MTLHLIKLSVGTESLDTFKTWQEERFAQKRALGEPEQIWHVTRAFPRRAAEVLDGGCLYWVIKRQIVARQKIAALEKVTVPGVNGDESEKPRCAIILDPGLIPVRPVPRKPFQGWRYFDPKDVPPDLRPGEDPNADLPPEMAAELRDLGLI